MTLVLSDEDLDFLQHYGVKGMKWGVRRSQAQLDRNAGRKPSRRQQRKAKRAELNKRNKKYTESQRVGDRQSFGRGGEKRINRRMNKGRSRTTAYLTELGQTAVKVAVGTAAANVVVGEILTGGAGTKMVGNLAGRKLHGAASKAANAYAKRQAGKSAVNALTSNAMLKRIRPRGGVYKITSM